MKQFFYNMKIAIILNGKFFDFQSQIKKYDFIIAADGGANYCRELKIKPNIIIGDFDSITSETQKYFTLVPQIKIAEQETTDLEKVLLYVKNNVKKDEIEIIDIFCALDTKRIDHFFALTNLLKDYANWPIQMVSNDFTLEVVSQDKNLINCQNKIVSIFPLEHAEHLELIGFKWPLRGKQISVSNIVISNEAKIKIQNGKIILIINLCENY